MKQTSLFGTDASTCSQADSLVSPTQSQVIDVGKRTSDISGQRCLERLEKLNHVGSLARTFTVLLIGMTGWSSTKCKLTWKMKGTRFKRTYFQLRASTPHIRETESGLLPTATAQDFKRRGPKSKQQGLSNTENWVGMLPTPVSSDVEGGISDPRQIKKHNNRWVRVSDNTGTMFGAKMRDVAQMLPTPKSQEARGNASRDRGKHNLTDEVSKMHEHDGTPSQLNPLFVEEMMGFPENWTLLPFLNGAQSPSKPTEMP